MLKSLQFQRHGLKQRITAKLNKNLQENKKASNKEIKKVLKQYLSNFARKNIDIFLHRNGELKVKITRSPKKCNAVGKSACIEKSSVSKMKKILKSLKRRNWVFMKICSQRHIPFQILISKNVNVSHCTEIN